MQSRIKGKTLKRKWFHQRWNHFSLSIKLCSPKRSIRSDKSSFGQSFSTIFQMKWFVERLYEYFEIFTCAVSEMENHAQCLLQIFSPFCGKEISSLRFDDLLYWVPLRAFLFLRQQFFSRYSRSNLSNRCFDYLTMLELLETLLPVLRNQTYVI